VDYPSTLVVKRVVLFVVLGCYCGGALFHALESSVKGLLYAWFVYRFHPIAEQQALATLEFALRERLILLGAIGRNDEWVPGLRKLLKDATARGLIGNERFPNRER
jgi:hypothetical protein